MSARGFGVLLFALLFLGVALVAVLSVLAYIGHAADGEGMQPVAGGFGVLVSLVPLGIILSIPVFFLMIFLAIRPRRR
jgi:hypothetical protein